MRFDVPAGITDPARRIKSIHECTGRVRHEKKSIPYTQLIASALNAMPRWYIGSVLRHVDFLCSDVPGVPVPVYLGGAAVRKQYAFGPTVGAAVNVTLLTYVDTCALGIDVDAGASQTSRSSATVWPTASTKSWHSPIDRVFHALSSMTWASCTPR